MRTALIVATLISDASPRVIAGPADPQSIAQAYKKIIQNPDGFATVELWTSGKGVEKKKRFAQSTSISTHSANDAGDQQAAESGPGGRELEIPAEQPPAGVSASSASEEDGDEDSGPELPPVGGKASRGKR